LMNKSSIERILKLLPIFLYLNKKGVLK